MDIKIGEYSEYFGGGVYVIKDFVQLFNISMEKDTAWVWGLVRDEVWKFLQAIGKIKEPPTETLEFPPGFDFTRFHILLIAPDLDVTFARVYIMDHEEEKTREIHDILLEFAEGRFPVVLTEDGEK